MSLTSLAVIIVTLTASVVLAIFVVLWRARRTLAQSGVAVVSAVVLAAWALGAGTLARRGFFVPPDSHSPPPVGIALGLALALLTVCLLLFP
jgi:hypothetical protein